MKRAIVALLIMLLALLSSQGCTQKAVPLLSGGVTNLISLTLSEDLVVAGASTFAVGSIANAALAAPSAYFTFPIFWSTEITNTNTEVWRTQMPVAFTSISLTLSVGAVDGDPFGTALINMWDDGVRVGHLLETRPTAATYYQGTVTGTIAASSVLTVEVETSAIGLTDSQITIWGYAAHQ